MCITFGLSLALFEYSQQETTDNTITRGINIIDAFPISDSEGKLLVGEGNVFDFNINSTTMSNVIDYEITARMKNK